MKASRRAILLLSLLLLEGWLLSIRFDTQHLFLDLRGVWWGRPIAYISELPRYLIAVGTVLLLAGRRLTTNLDRAAEQEPPLSDARIRGLVGMHFVSLGGFFFLSRAVLEGFEPRRFLLLWLCVGALTVGFLIFAVARRGVLALFMQRMAPVLILSIGTGFAAWAAGHFMAHFAAPLQQLTARAVFVFVRAFRSNAFLRMDDLVVGTPAFDVEIAPACSGWEGMGLIAVFLGIFLWARRTTLKFPIAYALVPIGILLAAFFNVIRLGALVLIGEQAPRVAQGGFHSYAGAVLFSAVALGTAFAAQQSARFSRELPKRAEPSSEVDGDSDSEALLAPFVVFLAVQLLTGLSASDGIDRLYGLRVFAAILVLVRYRGRLPIERKIDPTAIMIGVAVTIGWLLVANGDPAHASQLIERAQATPRTLVVAWLVVRAIGAVLIVPVIEELAFRGYLMRRLGAGVWPLVISSVVFGVLHAHIVAGTFAGVAYALAVRRKGRLTDGIVAHATTNLGLILYALTTGRWDAWL